MDGVLVIDKPCGPTSHDVVSLVKRITRAKKVGHLGTLDPMATGVLPLVLNGATKLASRLSGSEKIYEFILRLGAKTDTDDDAGKIIATSAVPSDYFEKITAILPKFTGHILQRPPEYSAIKIKGEKACDLARKGITPEIEPRPVTIDSISIIGHNGLNLHMKVECQKGTYVRSLCRDLGEAIGTFGHASSIRRTKSGRYTLDDAVTLDELKLNPDIWKRKLFTSLMSLC